MPKPIKIQTVVDINPLLAEQIDSYLSEKETDLGKKIAEIMLHPEAEAEEKPELRAPEAERVRLSDAVETVAKRIRVVHEPKKELLPEGGWHTQIRKINQAFWEYIEVLEGGVTELFLQVGLAGLERWNQTLLGGVEAIKEVLIHRIEDATWAVRRLENHLKEYRALCETKQQRGAFWKKWMIYWQPVLDPALLLHLGKSEKYLKNQYQIFIDHHHQYRKLWDEVWEYFQKLRSFQVLGTLDEERQRLFADIIRLIRLWENNARQKAFPQEEVIHALKRRVRPEQAIELFHSYKEALNEAIFLQSRELKKPKKANSSRKEEQDQLILYRREVRALMNTIAKYREFLLRTDPDPYVRSRWGFTEWIVGPEPNVTKRFIDLIYETKDLKQMLDGLIKSLSEPTLSFSEFARSDLAHNIDYTLHEMAQPLNTQEMMERRAEVLMGFLEECKELGSPAEKMIDFVGEVLLRGMRADGKYQVLQKNPLFTTLYHQHMGIVGEQEEEGYRLRKEKLKKTISSITQAFQKADKQVELDHLEEYRNDLRGDLQDFLGFIQKKSGEKLDKTQRFLLKQQLVEIRFLCSRFLSFLGEKRVEGQVVKRSFLFIDAYLDSAEEAFE